MTSTQNVSQTTAQGAIPAPAAAQKRAKPIVAVGSSYKKSKPTTLIFSYVILIIAVLFSVYPIYYAFLASIRPGNQLVTGNAIDIFIPREITLENYQKMLVDNKFPSTDRASGQIKFWRWLGNSALVASFTAVISMLIALPTALALSRFRFAGRRGLLIGLFVLQSFPGVLFIVPYINILRALGVYGQWLGLVVAYGAGGIIFTAWNMKGYFDTIPVEIEESAMIDGCNVLQSFFRVLLPLSIPAIAVTFFFNFQRGWTDFFLASVLIPSPDSANTLPVALQKLANDRAVPWGNFAAASILIMIPSALIFAYVQRFLQSGLTVGGVKG